MDIIYPRGFGKVLFRKLSLKKNPCKQYPAFQAPYLAGTIFHHRVPRRLLYELEDLQGYLWPYGPDGETSIHLPTRAPYGPSPTLRLPPADTTGMVRIAPGRPRRRAPAQQAEEHVPAPAQPAPVPQPTEWDSFYHRLDQRLVQSENTMAGHFAGLTDRMGRLELHVQRIDTSQQALQREMTAVQQGYRDVRAEQTRARESFDGYHTYVEEQWRQYWDMHPPPPPPAQF